MCVLCRKSRHVRVMETKGPANRRGLFYLTVERPSGYCDGVCLWTVCRWFAVKEAAMHGLRLIALGLAVGLAVCGCKERGPAPSERKDAKEEQEGAKEAAMGVTVKWLGHASFRISHEDTVIYIDPWKVKDAAGDADVVLVSHSHYDHYSQEDIDKVSGPDTKLLASNDVVVTAGGRAITPALTVELEGVEVTGVAAYNPNKQFHPKRNQWVGFALEVGGKRIYYAGDTDLIDEMKGLKDIDLALLPVGGTYTMSAAEAVEAVGRIGPRQAVPYHWGDIVGGAGDAEQFARNARCEVKVLQPGDSLSL